jgi:hypothetical protein
MQAALGSFDSFEEENEKYSFAKQDGESFYLFFNKLQTNTTSVHLQLYLLGRFTVSWVCLAPNHLAPREGERNGKTSELLALSAEQKSFESLHSMRS